MRIIIFIAVVLGYLYPLHLPPWTVFFNDFIWAIALVFSVALFFLGVNEESTYPLNSLVALSLLLVFTSTGVVWFYPGEAVFFWGVYVGLAILAFGVGIAARRQPEFLRLMLSALLLAALISAVLSLFQWLGVFATGDWNPGFVMRSNGNGRVHSNIGQANNFGTLLIMGMWALFELTGRWKNTRVGRSVVLLLLLILALGVFFSGSRTALLNLAVAPVLVWVLCRWHRQPFAGWSVLPLGMVLACSVAISWLSAVLGGGETLSVRDFSDPVRLRLWQLAWEGIMQSPWFGYGLDQLGFIYLQLAPQFGSFNSTIPINAHNTVLDLWLAFGLPIGSLVVLGVFWLWARAALRAHLARDVWLWLMPTVVLVHAMLEYPLHYGFFLWPFFLLLGILNAPATHAIVDGRSPHVATVRGSAWRYGFAGVWLFTSMGALFTVWKSYVETEALYTQARNRGLTAQDMQAQTHPWAQVLFPDLHMLLEWTIRQVDGNMTENELQRLTETAQKWPTPQLMWNVAAVNAFQGRPEVSAWWLERVCVMYPDQCREVKEGWLTIAAESKITTWPVMPWAEWERDLTPAR